MRILSSGLSQLKIFGTVQQEQYWKLISKRCKSCQRHPSQSAELRLVGWVLFAKL